LLYYVDYVVIGQDVLFFLLIFLVSLLIGALILPKKLPKWEGKGMMMYSLFFIAAAFGVLFFIGYNLILAVIPFFVVGFFFAGATIGNGVLVGDVIDNDELITGKRREAIYGGVNAIITKPAISIANWLFLTILTVFNFQQPVVVNGVAVKQPQPEIAIIGILLAFCLMPAIFITIGAIALRWYPLEGPEWQKKKQKVIEMHAQKEREYLKKIAKEQKDNE